jgi:hypothetical protein
MRSLSINQELNNDEKVDPQRGGIGRMEREEREREEC